MKMALLISLLFTGLLYANENKNESISAPPNAASGGQSESSGISDSPSGLSREEAKKLRTRSESMGGAPNAGGGMGTGTGAGSTVGDDVGEGTLTSGAASGKTLEE